MVGLRIVADSERVASTVPLQDDEKLTRMALLRVRREFIRQACIQKAVPAHQYGQSKPSMHQE
jgi:hypothetical protein